MTTATGTFNLHPPILKSNSLHYFIGLDKTKEPDTDTIMSGKNKALAKSGISKSDSPIDVVIFKQAIATGGDIPRACMLVQFRDISSPNLTTQTIGRVRRNPLLKYGGGNLNATQQNLTSTYWLYSIHKSAEKFTQEKVVRKDKFKNSDLKISTTKFDDGDPTNPKKRDFIAAIKKDIGTHLLKLYNSDHIEKTLNKIKSNHGIYEEWERVTSNGREYKRLKFSLSNVFEVKSLGNEVLKDKKLIQTVEPEIEKFAETKHTTSFAIKVALLTERNLETINELKDIGAVQNLNIHPVVKGESVDIPDGTFDKGKDKYTITIDDKSGDAGIFEHEKDPTNQVFLGESNAEKAVLKELRNYFNDSEKSCEFFTKNFLQNSDIKFAYYKRLFDSENGLFDDAKGNSNEIAAAQSFPDVVLRFDNNTYIIEIKGLDHGSKTAVNDKEYQQKIDSLDIGYTENSKVLPEYIFALVLYKDNQYIIMKYQNGKVKQGKDEQNLDRLFEK